MQDRANAAVKAAEWRWSGPLRTWSPSAGSTAAVRAAVAGVAPVLHAAEHDSGCAVSVSDPTGRWVWWSGRLRGDDRAWRGAEVISLVHDVRGETVATVKVLSRPYGPDTAHLQALATVAAALLESELRVLAESSAIA